MEQKNKITIRGKTFSYYPKQFEGNKPPLDIPVARENLSSFANIAGKHRIPIILIYGTLLGAVRERSFLPYDTDTDITIDRKYEYMLLEINPELEKAGLLFVRYMKQTFFNKGIIIYSFMRNGMYIDVYIMQKEFDGYIILGEKYPRKHFDELDSLQFYNHEYLTPHNPEGFLAYVYGEDWRTPKPDCHSSYVKLILRLRLKLMLIPTIHSMIHPIYLKSPSFVKKPLRLAKRLTVRFLMYLTGIKKNAKQR
jgi:hypothetical protein